jgi:tyrosine-protein kinase
VSLEQVAARTAHRLGPNFDPKEISDSVEVSPKGTSNVVDVKATWRSPRTAARIATTFAQQFVHFEARAERFRISVAQRRLRLSLERERQSATPDQPRISTIQGNLDDLEVLKSVNTGQAQVIQRADVPTSRSSPRPMRNGLIGIFAGLLLALGLAIALEQLDRRVRSAAELEELLHVPLLAQVPESEGFITAAIRPISAPPVEVEIFSALCTTLQRLNGRQLKSVLVTGPTAEVGKTTMALNLALAAARSGLRTLFLEVDMRRPIVAVRLGLPSERSLVGALSGGLPLSEAVQSIPMESSDSPELEDMELDVVVAGPPSRDAARLVESEEMARLIKEAERTYDLVVVDAPPAGLLSDAIALLSLVGGAILVCRLGKTRREEVQWLESQLERVDANVLGVLANFAPLKLDQYYGAYRWAGQPEAARTASTARGQQQRPKDRVT